MRNIKLIIEYDGTHFQGWQTQQSRRGKSTVKSPRTVQGEIEAALEKIFKTNVTLDGSGRTDSGVHAAGQVANFKIKNKMPAAEIKNALNGNLPKDVVVIDAKDVNSDFHAQYSAKSKVYRYTVINCDTRSPLRCHFALLYNRQINVSLMRKEAAVLLGRHDFKSFEASDPVRQTKDRRRGTVRTIKRMTVKKKGDEIIFEIEADGFLYKMVRNIVGTLLEIGCGRLPPGSMKAILAQKDRKRAGATAKARGLSLLEVKY